MEQEYLPGLNSVLTEVVPTLESTKQGKVLKDTPVDGWLRKFINRLKKETIEKTSGAISQGEQGKSAKAGTTAKDVDPKQLKAEIKVEHEHSSDPRVQKEIALDHLTEFTNYYTGPAKMEKELKKKAMVKKAVSGFLLGRAYRAAKELGNIEQAAKFNAAATDAFKRDSVSFGITRKAVEMLKKSPDVKIIRKRLPKSIQKALLEGGYGIRRNAEDIGAALFFKGVTNNKKVMVVTNNKKVMVLPKGRTSGNNILHEAGHLAGIGRDPFQQKATAEATANTLLAEQSANTNALRFIKNNSNNVVSDTKKFNTYAQRTYDTYLKDYIPGKKRVLSIIDFVNQLKMPTTKKEIDRTTPLSVFTKPQMLKKAVQSYVYRNATIGTHVASMKDVNKVVDNADQEMTSYMRNLMIAKQAGVVDNELKIQTEDNNAWRKYKNMTGLAAGTDWGYRQSTSGMKTAMFKKAVQSLTLESENPAFMERDYQQRSQRSRWLREVANNNSINNQPLGM